MDNEDEDQHDGTNDPFPFGDPPDVECYCDRIRVSSDPSVIERLRAAAGPPNPADLLREERENIAAGDLFVRDEEFPSSVGGHGPDRKQMDEKLARLGSDLTAMDQGANFIFTGKIDALRALESSGLVNRFGLDDPRHFL